MEHHYQVIVYGATPGGIGAAIAAARRGRKTLLVEPSAKIGGMMTSGLGRTDILSHKSCGAIFREFMDKVMDHYTKRYGADSEQVKDCNRGLFFEPSVAKQLLWDMLRAEPLLSVECLQELVSTETREGRLQSLTIRSSSGMEMTVEADIFIDGSYEGDLAASAGAPYAIGRESRDEWNEEYAGKLYIHFGEDKKVFPGSTGEGDRRVQAYNYRLCLTDKPENRVTVAQPPVYNRVDYVSLIDDVREGRVGSIRQVLNMLPIPNGKTDSNNHHFCMCSSDLPEENDAYAEGDRATRLKIEERHRFYLQGLLWFLQNDDQLPQAFRDEAGQWGYSADEFVDSEHFPPQLYVREGRRIRGEYTFTENDARLAPGLGRAPIHYDSIAVGDYPIDSHATRKREPAGENVALEGFLGLHWITEIYQIPYGVMVPQAVEGLLVPVAVSSTHMGIGTIRMEPCWMQLGFAAGVAADLSMAHNLPLRSLSVDVLQDELLAENQLITYFRDIDDLSDDSAKAVQYFGTKGFFESYEADIGRPVTVREASLWLAQARSLPGGKRIPALPASNAILPAGVDMGPRLPRTEPSPRDYWASEPILRETQFRRWLNVAEGRGEAAKQSENAEQTRAVTRGELCSHLYRILQSNRSR